MIAPLDHMLVAGSSDNLVDSWITVATASAIMFENARCGVSVTGARLGYAAEKVAGFNFPKTVHVILSYYHALGAPRTLAARSLHQSCVHDGKR
jgi:hypothetical protein